MQILPLAALAVCVAAQECTDEAVLMQTQVERSSSLNQLSVTSNLMTKEGRAASMGNLLEIATRMIKSGVTPDVVSFVDSTKAEIQNVVLPAILDEHDRDQTSINDLLAEFDAALADLEAEIANDALHANRLGAVNAHQECRAEEAITCARYRKCTEELDEYWIHLKHEEEGFREVHEWIQEGYCLDPNPYPHLHWEGMNWARTMPYPVIDWPGDVKEFIRQMEIHKRTYLIKYPIVWEAWVRYRSKITECAELEVTLDSAVEECDNLQDQVQSATCEHSRHNREFRREFASRWSNLLRDYNDEVARITENEYDRKREWENLYIVTCLLTHIHVSVENAIATGSPCPTEDSDPESVRASIEECHLISEPLTEHLTIIYGTPPPLPPLPPVIDPPCSPEAMVSEQWTFDLALQTTFTATLENEGLLDYLTTLSEAGWPGCAAPKVCVNCEGMEVVSPDETRTEPSQVCGFDQEYLMPGQSNLDTFRCLGGWCLSMSGRCNGVAQCGDGSDELGCEESGHPAYLPEAEDCPAELGLEVGESNDVTFRCGDGKCTKRSALCNGQNNCADGSDENHCHGHGPIQVTAVATSGRTISVDIITGQAYTNTGDSPSLLQVASSASSGAPEPYSVFHDRDYTVDNCGGFCGDTHVRYSNDDKDTDFSHVMTKLTISEPAVVVIVVLRDSVLPWLESEGYVPVHKTGLTYSGPEQHSAHTEWSGTLSWQSFEASQVHGQYFDAGVISIPGNDGGTGSFLIFLERPDAR